MLLKSTSIGSVSFIDHRMLFVQLGGLHKGAHFGVVEGVVQPLLVGTSLIDKAVKGSIHSEGRIFLIRSRPLEIIWEYVTQLDLLSVYQTDSDADTRTDS